MLSTVVRRGELVDVRGELIPLVRLHELFAVNDGCSNPLEALVIVVENGEKRCCVMVDDLLGQQQVVIKSLGGYFKNLNGVAGGAILGDGRVGLILDVDGLMEWALH